MSSSPALLRILTQDRCRPLMRLPLRVPGMTWGLPLSRGPRASTAVAAGDSCTVRGPVLANRRSRISRAARSTSSQRSFSTSPLRQPVSSSSRIATAACAPSRRRSASDLVQHPAETAELLVGQEPLVPALPVHRNLPARDCCPPGSAPVPRPPGRSGTASRPPGWPPPASLTEPSDGTPTPPHGPATAPASAPAPAESCFSIVPR